jgi:hypothetical protein
MTHCELQSALAGLVFLAVGLLTIYKRRIAIRTDSWGEEDAWVYGWRALAVGCVAVGIAGLLFASAVGIIHVHWSRCAA